MSGEEGNVFPAPWDDNTKSITASVGLEEAVAAAVNTIPDKTTYIRSTISLTNGKVEGEETIPNLYEAVKAALSHETASVKTDSIAYLTPASGDVKLILGVYDAESQTTTDTSYSLRKMVEAIQVLGNRTQHMVDPDHDAPIDILWTDPEPGPEPEP